MKFRDILKKESETLHALFISNVEILRSSFLSFSTPVFYTSHGIDHSQNIESIIDAFVPNHLKEKMNTQEIFMLLSSMYFHDVGMALIAKDKGYSGSNDYFRQVDEARRIHSEKSASFVLQNCDEFGLSTAQAEIIAWICRAHSDIKNTDGTRIYTFADLMNRADETNIDTVPIKVKYLAALLRLADELDITSKRAPGKQLKIMDLPLESQMEWMKHQIFSGVSINPNIWAIDLDVSETLLYSDTKGVSRDKDRTALTNKLVTDVATKIRKALMEVKPPLLKEGVLYRKIRFRDPVIRKLEEILGSYKINLDGITFLYDIEPTVTYGGYHQNFLYEIEQLELSPEYNISKAIDDRLFQSFDFFSNFESNLFRILDIIESKNDVTGKIQNSVIKFLGKYVKRRGLKEKEIYENEKEEYIAYIDSVGKYVFKRNILGEFSADLRYELYEIIEEENIFKKTEDTNLFINMVLTDIVRDLFLQGRRRIMEDKLDSHYFFHIIPKSYFFNIINTSAQNPLGRDRWICNFEKTLSYLKNLMGKSDGRFKLYIHNNDTDLDYRIMTSEVVLLPGRAAQSNIVITEMESIIQFYDDFQKVLESNDTWLIEDIDTKNFRIKLGRDDKFQGIYAKESVQREKVESQLSAILSRITNENRDNLSSMKPPKAKQEDEGR